MHKKDPDLWAALRLHQILRQVHEDAKTEPMSMLRLLLQEQRAVERGFRMLQTAQTRGWTHAADIVARQLRADVTSVHRASQAMRRPHLPDLPTVDDLLAEIRHLRDEFDKVEIVSKEGRIEVTTDEITLNDVRLGRFCIQLRLERLTRRRDVSAFAIVARKPNAAAGDRSCMHPHVSDESLCAGDAAIPISNALADGRIGDAFQLINRVLHTYNSGSAYVGLDSWSGSDCADCGRTTSSDGLYSCAHCGQDFCDDCMRTCDRCEEPVCRNCSTTIENGSRLCSKCKEPADQEPDEASDEEEDETIVLDDPDHDSIEEQPQPPTEIHHEQSHAPNDSDPRRTDHPGGAADAPDRNCAVPDPHPQAA